MRCQQLRSLSLRHARFLLHHDDSGECKLLELSQKMASKRSLKRNAWKQSLASSSTLLLDIESFDPTAVQSSLFLTLPVLKRISEAIELPCTPSWWITRLATWSRLLPCNRYNQSYSRRCKRLRGQTQTVRGRQGASY